MRAMTSPAVIGVFGMLINKGTFFFRMTLRAGVLERKFFKQFLAGSSVRFMAIRAEDLLLRNRMMARHRKFRLHLMVAALTHVFHLLLPDGKIGACMNFMAFEAGNIILRMGANIPVVQPEICRGGMAFQAYEGLGWRRQLFEIYQGLMVTRCQLAGLRVNLHLLGSQTFDGQTAGAMAGLAVDKRQAGLR